MRPHRRILFAVLVLALTASAASARYYTVTLANGTSFDTRYKPVDAEWDDSVALFLTDRGNWIAISKSEIVDVVSEAEASGFGYQVNTTTLFLGWSPNDLVDDPEDGGAEGDSNAVGAGGGPGEEEEPYLYGDEAEDTGYGLEQFIDIPVGGGTLPGPGISVGPIQPSGASEGRDSSASDG